MSTRIYVVTDIETSRHRLIRASNQAQAIRHAAQTRFDIEVAGQEDLVSLLTNGIPIELAGAGATADMFEDAITNAGGTD
jgi:hypothetical protein